MGWIELKQKAKKMIASAVQQADSVDKRKLIAQICLDTGFSEATISKMLQQMADLGYVYINGNVVKRHEDKAEGGQEE